MKYLLALANENLTNEEIFNEGEEINVWKMDGKGSRAFAVPVYIGEGRVKKSEVSIEKTARKASTKSSSPASGSRKRLPT